VLWAITPKAARPILAKSRNGTSGKLTTTELQVFGLLVTAEPFAVSCPSDVVDGKRSSLRYRRKNRVDRRQ
jgi:hypothetical protein